MRDAAATRASQLTTFKNMTKEQSLWATGGSAPTEENNN
jgi:hypothetical protein